MWADGIYMAEPFLLQYGTLFDDFEYAAGEATAQTLLLAEHAYDDTKHLIYHGWDETKEASWADDDGRSPCVWSRGMGWYCMALVDMLDYLPETNDHYNDFVELVQGLAKGIKENQDDVTGLWYQVVDAGDNKSNWIETSGSAMFVYMLEKALDNSYVDSSYVSVIDKGWTGMQNKVTSDSKGMPVINDFVGGMGIKSSISSYLSQTLVSCPTSKHPHGYCAILSLASVMEWPKEKVYKLETNITGNGSIIENKPDALYMPGRFVKLTARAAEGENFTGWSGDITGSDTVVYVEMDASKSVTASFSGSTSSDPSIMKKEWGIAPNPVSDILIVSNVDSNANGYEIIAANGTVLKSGNIGYAEEIQIPVNDLPEGVYFIRVDKTVKKFVKK